MDKPQEVTLTVENASDYIAEDAAAERGLTEPSTTLAAPEPVSDEEADKLWRAGLDAEMRPIALRYGRKLFTLCANVNNASVGLTGLQQLAIRTRNELDKLHARKAGQAVLQQAHNVHQILDQAIATFIAGWALAEGITREQMIEVQTDMARARALAQAAPPSGIVLPGGGH